MTETEDLEYDGLAAEYVLGTLDASERGQAEALMRSDKAFAAKVEGWKKRFDPLLMAAPPISPPAGALEAVLSAVERPTRAPGAEVMELRRQIKALKWTAGVTLAMAASVLAFVFVGGPRPSPTPFVAILESPDRAPAFVAVADPTHGGLLVRRVGAEPPPGRSFELWAIRDGAPPRSLGVVDVVSSVSAGRLAEGTVGLPLPNIVLAITDEPMGGSPNGKPSGAPVFTGRFVQTPAL